MGHAPAPLRRNRRGGTRKVACRFSFSTLEMYRLHDLLTHTNPLLKPYTQRDAFHGKEQGVLTNRDHTNSKLKNR